MADRYVLDTGVLLRWYVEQDGFEHAREVLTDGSKLITSDFGRVEFADVLRRKALRPGRLDRERYLAAVADLEVLGVEIVATDRTALLQAAGLAADRRVRLFDAIFVVTALARRSTLLTSDARLSRAVSGLVSTEVLRGVAAAP